MADILNLKTVVNTVVSNNINAQLAMQAVADSVDIRDNLTDVVYPQLVAEVNNANAILSDIQDEKLIIADYVTTVTSNTVTSQNAVIDVLSMKEEITNMVEITQTAVEDTIVRLEDMETVWLGTHSIPPTTVNSLPITAGAVYFNSITNSLYVYNGTVWVSMVNNLLVAADVKALYEDNPDTNEFNDAEKLKLAGIASNAEVNVNADWTAINGDAQILNKPTTIAGFGITDAYTKTEINAHINNTLNPHAVTKTQVGLSNVDNTSDETKWSATATITNKIIDSSTNLIGADHIHYRVKNMTGSTLASGTIVKVVAYEAGEETIRVASVSSANDVAIGILEQSITHGNVGLAVNTGVANSINTTAYTAGSILYNNNSGGLTSVKPTSGMYQACAVPLNSKVDGALLVEFSEPTFISSTLQAGYVQLNDTLTSTSTVQALTAARGKVLKDSIDTISTQINNGVW